MTPTVLQVLQPPDGGVAEHVLGLARGLPQRGFAVEVALGADSDLRGPLAAAGIPVHVLPLARDPSPADLGAARALRALDARGGYALVHAHSSKAGALARAVLPRRRRLVYSPHCFAFLAGLGARRTLYRLAEQALVPRSAAIVCASEWERREALRALRGAASTLRVVENGVTEPAGDPDPRLVEFAAGRPLAAMVSVLRPQKAPLALVRAAARLAGAGELPGRVAIVGNGELRDAVEAEIARLDVSEHVRWFVYPGTVGPALRAIDLYVLPSLWESFPIGVLEAMACGLPVLATSVGGVPDAVADGATGVLVPPGDEAALARALRELLGDPARRAALGAAGRERARERYPIERTLDRVAALYRELLAA